MPQYVDKDKIKLNSLTWIDGDKDILVPLVAVKKAIAQTPTEEEVVKVVRCKDCRYCYNNLALRTFRCERYMAVVDPHNFCSYGKEK